MGNSLLARDIFKRDFFRSYSEFCLALCMAKVLGSKGMSLDMTGMKVDLDSIGEAKNYYKVLLKAGYIVLEGGKDYSDLDVKDTLMDVDVSYFNVIPLFGEKEGYLYWSNDYAMNEYGKYNTKFLVLSSLGITLLHAVAYHLVNCLLSGEVKVLKIFIDEFKAKSAFTYLDIYSCLQSMLWLSDYLVLDVDLRGYSGDLDYSVFCRNGRVAGHYKKYTIDEKLRIMDIFGMHEGAILIMWSRVRMSENNEYGEIDEAKVVRLDEIGDTFIGVTEIAVNKTAEESKQDYYDIDEEIRYLFVDMLDKKPFQSAREYDICNIGIDNYFYDEANFLTLLDNCEKVSKLVTIDGKVESVEMREVDAIYWILCQYGIEFDKDLFKYMYMEGKETLWDMYN